MTQPVTSGTAQLARMLRAASIGGLAGAGMWAMQAGPAWLPMVVGVGIAALALAAPEVAVILAIIALCLPVLAVNAVVGIAMAIVLLSAEHFFGRGGGGVFILTGAAFAGVFFGPAWAAAALAGYLLGAGEGAIAAAAACALLELLGLFTAAPAIGVLATGGAGHPALDFTRAPDSLLSTEWIVRSFKSIGPESLRRVGAVLAHVEHPLALALQLGGWALAAVVAGTILARAPRRNTWVALAAVSAGTATAWCADGIARLAAGAPGTTAASTAALAASLIVVWIFTAVAETVFAAKPVAASDGPPAENTAAPAMRADQETARQPGESTPELPDSGDGAGDRS